MRLCHRPNLGVANELEHDVQSIRLRQRTEFAKIVGRTGLVRITARRNHVPGSKISGHFHQRFIVRRFGFGEQSHDLYIQDGEAGVGQTAAYFFELRARHGRRVEGRLVGKPAGHGSIGMQAQSYRIEHRVRRD